MDHSYLLIFMILGAVVVAYFVLSLIVALVVFAIAKWLRTLVVAVLFLFLILVIHVPEAALYANNDLTKMNIPILDYMCDWKHCWKSNLDKTKVAHDSRLLLFHIFLPPLITPSSQLFFLRPGRIQSIPH